MDRITALEISRALHQALPYLHRFDGKTLVLKIGGSVLNCPDLLRDFVADVALMHFVGMQPIIVHGGGPRIDAQLRKNNIEPRFEDGLRVTDAATIEIVHQILSEINAEIATALTQSKAMPARFCELNVSPLIATPRSGHADDHLGSLQRVDDRGLRECLQAGQIPVVSPVGRSADGAKAYNINADLAAGHIAAQIAAVKMILLTDVEGISRNGKLLKMLSPEEVPGLISTGVIHGGMLPKVRCAMQAITAAVPRVHIIDGRLAHATLLEIFTRDGVGTLITDEPE